MTLAWLLNYDHCQCYEFHRRNCFILSAQIVLIRLLQVPKVERGTIGCRGLSYTEVGSARSSGGLGTHYLPKTAGGGAQLAQGRVTALQPNWMMLQDPLQVSLGNLSNT